MAVNGPQRVGSIAQQLRVGLSVASRQVAALAAEGYVERTRDPGDGRAQIIELTESGRRALRESHARMVSVFAEVLTGWAPDEIAALSGALGRRAPRGHDT